MGKASPKKLRLKCEKWARIKWSEKSLCCVPLFATPWTVDHEIPHNRILEWVAFPFPRGSSQPRDGTQVSHIAGGFFTGWVTREAQEYWSEYPIHSPEDFPNPGIKLGCPALQADSLLTELSGKFRRSGKSLRIGWGENLQRPHGWNSMNRSRLKKGSGVGGGGDEESGEKLGRVGGPWDEKRR